jgi:hypothetical protein
MSPYVNPLSASEVAEALGLRRFLLLCQMFDGRKKEKECKATKSLGAFGYLGNFRTSATIKASTPYAHFDVLRIAEVRGVLHVHCEDEYGQVFDVTVDYKDKRPIHVAS